MSVTDGNRVWLSVTVCDKVTKCDELWKSTTRCDWVSQSVTGSDSDRGWESVRWCDRLCQIVTEWFKVEKLWQSVRKCEKMWLSVTVWQSVADCNRVWWSECDWMLQTVTVGHRVGQSAPEWRGWVCQSGTEYVRVWQIVTRWLSVSNCEKVRQNVT